MSTQRSGSGYLSKCLGSHQDVTFLPEIFKPDNKKPLAYRGYRTASVYRRFRHVAFREQLIDEYLQHLTQDCATMALGFRLMYAQLDKYPHVAAWAARNGAKVIHLIRGNKLKILVSRKVARERGIWSSNKELPSITINLNPTTIVRELHRESGLPTEYQEKFDACEQLIVEYEHFVRAKSDECNRMLDFLGLHRAPLTADSVKVTSDSLEKVVANYADIKRALAGSPYEHYLS